MCNLENDDFNSTHSQLTAEIWYHFRANFWIHASRISEKPRSLVSFTVFIFSFVFRRTLGPCSSFPVSFQLILSTLMDWELPGTFAAGSWLMPFRFNAANWDIRFQSHYLLLHMIYTRQFLRVCGSGCIPQPLRLWADTQTMQEKSIATCLDTHFVHHCLH